MANFDSNEVIEQLLTSTNNNIAARMQERIQEKLDDPDIPQNIKDELSNIPVPQVNTQAFSGQSSMISAIFSHLEQKIPEIFRVVDNPEYPEDPNADRYILQKRTT